MRQSLSRGSVIAALIASACTVPSSAQETVFKVDVKLIRVLATVKNPDGQLVGGLDKDDFSISDNGVPQSISIFERQTEQPLRIALLIDTSGSTAKDLKYEIESVKRFFKALFREGNSKDAVALYAFNYAVNKLNHFTRSQGTLEKSLRGLHAEAGTSLYDALYLASRELEGRDGRKVLVVVTDGGDTTSSVDFHKALQAAQLAEAVIYSILVMPITNDAGRNVGGENALFTLGQRTGGRVFSPSVGPALDQAFGDIIKELRTQYLLGFYPKDVPPSSNRFHTLSVKVRRPDLRVSARSGYYEESEK